MTEIILKPSQFITQSPPGDTLAEALDKRGMTQAEFAMRTGRPLKTINEIIKGKASITPDTALQFERVIGISAEFWLNREAQYRESQARQAEKQELQKELDWLKVFPLMEMAELGWITKHDNPLDQLQELLSYFGLARAEQWSIYWETVIPHIEKITSFQNAPGSTTAWLRKGEIESQKLSCNEFQTGALRSLLTYCHSLTNQSVNIIYSELVQKFSQTGVAFCVVESVPGLEIETATRWLSPTKVLLQLSTSYSGKKDFWLALYRGLAHILLHGKREVFLIERQNKKDSQLLIEAENFSREFLEDVQWIDPGAIIPWETTRQKTTEEFWPDLPEETSTESQTKESLFTITEPSQIMGLIGWPGLSEAALQTLMEAGLISEASNVDERLFAEWVKQKLATVESAFLQGYVRDALMDLEELYSMVRIGSKRSPALAAMLSSLELLKLIIEKQHKPDQSTLLVEIKQLITQANQDTHQSLISDERVRYSAATNVEKSLADNLFKF